ncbi:MAG: GAF domain-containing sensor histidine kinase [Pseudonocardia sp.]|nr:GAF domain-containing sensor histidine kinase [Pseudonocardia sp.]MBO0872116.1 GAF domain-containing sensor histidine kinase [Pseudonocardia sp.]
MELRGYAEEQAALRRVATLVAQGAAAEDVFAVVAEEVRRMLAVDITVICRYDPDMVLTYLGWSQNGNPGPVGARVPLGGWNVAQLVHETGRPARVNDYGDASGAAAEVVYPFGLRAAVGVPVRVEGGLWGVMTVASTTGPPPLGTETRLAGFTELVGTAIANAQARVELRGFADEQAAMRRVATLVARGPTPEKVFATVTAEAGALLGADQSVISRYTPDGEALVVGVWAGTGVPPVSVGHRLSLGGWDLHTQVFRTRRSARINDYGRAKGAAAEIARRAGVRSAVGVPIKVQDRVWGFIGISSGEEWPVDAEARLAGFTELVGTALANAEAQAELAASRARIVTAADNARRRIERDLHDGAQQRLVSALLQLRGPVRAAVPPAADELRVRLDEVDHELAGTLDELRELARGIHPSVLAGGGLRPALSTLAARSFVPVDLHLGVNRRLPEQVEIAAYYVISEALTNVAKHARASHVHVKVCADEADSGLVPLCVEVRDNGCGGAQLTGGSGLVGLKDRVEALGGTIRIESPVGKGTSLQVTLPIAAM